MGKSKEYNKEKQTFINNLARKWSDLNKKIKAGENSISNIAERHKYGTMIFGEVYDFFVGNESYKNWVFQGKFMEDVIFIGSQGLLADDFVDLILDSIDPTKSLSYDSNINDNYIAYLMWLMKKRRNNHKGGKLDVVIKDKEADDEKKDVKEGEKYEPVETEIAELDSKNFAIDLLVNCINAYEKSLTTEKRKERKVNIKEVIAFEVIYTFFIVHYIEDLKMPKESQSWKYGEREKDLSKDMTDEELEMCCDNDVRFAYLKKRDYHIYKYMKLIFTSMLKRAEVEELINLREIIKRALREGIDLDKKQSLIVDYLSKDEEFNKDNVTRQWVSEREKKFTKLVRKSVV